MPQICLPKIHTTEDFPAQIGTYKFGALSLTAVCSEPFRMFLQDLRQFFFGEAFDFGRISKSRILLCEEQTMLDLHTDLPSEPNARFLLMTTVHQNKAK